MSSEQTVRLTFLGNAGSALRATDQIIDAQGRLREANGRYVASSKQVSVEAGRQSAGMRTLEHDIGRTSRGALAGSGVFRSLGRSIAFASASFLGGYGLISVLRGSVNAMQETAANNVVTAQRIKVTGAAAGVTAKQIDVLAEATLRKTGYDKEQAVAAEQVLLGFTQIRNEVGQGNDVYDRAVHLTADLARAQKTDLSTAALQLGKALNDPVRGMTALVRAGVALTKSQRDEIAAYQESGQIVKAQKLLLDAVAGSVGGVAAAYGKNAGQISILRGELRELGGEYATALSPAIADATQSARKYVDQLKDNPAAQKEFRDDVVGTVSAIKDFVGIARDAVGLLGGMKNTLELLVALKVAKWAREAATGLGLLTGTEAAAGAASGGAGLAGAAGAAGLLRTRLLALTRLGAIAIPVELIINTKLGQDAFGLDSNGNIKQNGILGAEGRLVHDLFKGDPTTSSGWAQFGKDLTDVLLGTHYGSKGNGLVGGLPGGGTTVPKPGGVASDLGRGGVQIPTNFKSTHQTAGLAGFPAVDIMAKPGTPIKAPEDGHITRVDGHEPSEAPPQGQGGPWGLSLYFVGADTGNTYYMTHLMKVGELGFYKKGDRIGIIGDYPGSSADHVHVGIHQGASAQATFPSSLLNPNDFKLGSSGSTRSSRAGGGNSGGTKLQKLQLALATAGTTTGAADDRTALQALIAFYRKAVAAPGLPITTKISDENTLGGYISQLDALAPKKPGGGASKASLVVIKNTLAEVSKLVDQAGLDKKFDGQLGKINDLLDKKFVTTESLARIRIQLGKISEAAKAALDKAKKDVEARKQAFTDAWGKLADDAMAAFDKETADHVGPTRSLLNQMIGAHDKQQVDDAVTDAKKALDDALAGVNSSTDSDIVSQITKLVGSSALSNAIDKAQSGILGGAAQPVDGTSLLSQLQQILNHPGVDPAAVADAQKAYNEAVYQSQLYYLGLQADAEDSAYADGRAQLRSALEQNLAAWGAYYANLGTATSKAAGDFATVWSNTLNQFPTVFGGSNGGGSPDDPTHRTVDNSGAPIVKELSPGFNIPASVIGLGFGGSFDDGGIIPGLLGQPKMILAHGGERVLTPAQQAAGGGAGGRHMIQLSLGEPLDQMIESKVIQLTPQISVAIGNDAAMRARSGRF